MHAERQNGGESRTARQLDNNTKPSKLLPAGSDEECGGRSGLGTRVAAMVMLDASGRGPVHRTDCGYSGMSWIPPWDVDVAKSRRGRETSIGLDELF